MPSVGWIQKVKNNLKGSLQDLKKLSRQLSKEREQQKKAAAAAKKKQQRREMLVTDEDRKIFLASIRGTKPIADTNRIEASAPKSTAREAEFFKQKRAQAEGKEILALSRRRCVAVVDSTLPAHAQAATKTTSSRPNKSIAFSKSTPSPTTVNFKLGYCLCNNKQVSINIKMPFSFVVLAK